MEELVNLVSQKTGLDKDKSAQAVKIVVDFIKKKLPGPVAAQVDTVLNSGSAAEALGGLFGGKK